MRIAIIGTGIAGNVVAHKLSREHDITVYEANDYVGGHTNTVTVPAKDGDLKLDTGFIVYNDRTYPNFIRLLDELGVASQDSTMSFSVHDAASGLEYNGAGLNALFAQRRNLLRPSFYRMIADILRFNREALQLLDSDDLTLSLADYLRAGGYTREFSEYYLMPMGAAIWSAEPEMLEKIPASFFARFFHNHGLLNLKNRPQWRVIRGGSESYVDKLVANHRDRIRVSTPVVSVTRARDQVYIKARGCETETYDYAFLACHSDQALQMLGDALPLEREVLGAIPYQANEAILHCDDSVMPRRKLAWAAWNYHLAKDQSRLATLTYHLNRLQSLTCEKQYFVTLNSASRIRPETILQRIHYEHPVFTAQSVDAQNRCPDINGLNRTYYCGAYWRNGFHEDGVVSALEAVAQFEVRDELEQRYLQRSA